MRFAPSVSCHVGLIARLHLIEQKKNIWAQERQMAGKETSKSLEKAKSGEPFKPESKLDVSVSGTPGKGQKVQIANNDTLNLIFGTEHPELASALLRHCPTFRPTLGGMQYLSRPFLGTGGGSLFFTSTV